MQRDLLVYVNGELIPQTRASISVYDYTLVYGAMVFEVTRTFNFQPFRLRHHLDRLLASLRYAEIELDMSLEDLEKATYQTIEANREALQDGFDFVITHNVSPGIFDWYREVVPQGDAPTVIIFCWPLIRRLAELAPLYDAGVHGVIPWQRTVPSRFIDPKAKNRSRIYYHRANRQAQRLDPDAWAVLLDDDGFLAEGTGSNIFLVSNGSLYTPEGRNILRGVTRGFVLELAAEQGIPVVRRNLEPYDLLNADEAFFTSTSFGVMPMTRFDGRPVSDGRPGPVTRQLLQAFGQHVEVDLVEQARAAARLLAESSVSS